MNILKVCHYYFRIITNKSMNNVDMMIHKNKLYTTQSFDRVKAI